MNGWRSKKEGRYLILPLACTFLLRLSSSLKSTRAQYVGLKVRSFGEWGRQKGWQSLRSAAPRFRKNASEAYIWKKISGIWLAQILARPMLACRQLPSHESRRWRVSVDCCRRFFRIWCNLSWNWPINYYRKQTKHRLVLISALKHIPMSSKTSNSLSPGGY